MTIRLLARTSLMFFAACFIAVSAAFAVGVKPLRTEITIEPGSSATATIEIFNEENHVITVQPDIGTYTRNDEDGFPVRADFDSDDVRNIANWVSFPEDVITLQAGEKREVTFTVRAPKGAEPGGRYGSLIYTPVVDAGADEVAVVTRVASLLLITVAGDKVIDGELARFDLEQADAYGDRPFAFAVGLRNTGNIHIKPTGTITLINEDGEQMTGIARYLDKQTNTEIITDEIPVNIFGGNILPDSTRVFQSTWREGVVPGSYTAKLDLSYGAGTRPITSSFDFSLYPHVNVTSFELVPANDSSTFMLVLANTGDTHERPHGTIAILNDFDFIVAELGIPENLAYIAPGETGTIEIPWLSKELPDGHYTARLTATYGPTNALLTAETTFGSSGHWPLIMSIVIGIGLLIAAGAWHIIRRKKPMLEAHISDYK